MRHIRQSLPILTILLSGTLAWAADPVEELRQALRAPAGFEPAELQHRREVLEQRVQALGVGDLRRALMLQEWRDQDREFGIRSVDGKLRAQVVNRLQTTLRALLQGENTAAKLAAITQIAEMGAQVRGDGDAPLARSLAPDLIRTFDDPDPLLRSAAVRAFGKIVPGVKLIPEVGRLLDDPDASVRLAAAESLADLVRTLEPLTKSSMGTTYIMISYGEAAQLARAAVLTARRGLRQASPAIRTASLETVHQAAVLLLRLILDTQQDRRAVEDERAMVMPLVRALDEVVPDVTRSLADPRADIRLLAVRTLEEIGVSRQRLIRKAQSVPRKPLRKDIYRPNDLDLVAHQAADPLDEDPLRAKLVAAIPALASALGDSDVRVRRIAVNALETLAREPEIEPVLPAIARALADRDRFVRWAAARLVGRIGPLQTQETLPGLSRLLTDGDLDVQTAAATALGRLGPKAAAAAPTLAAQVSRGDAENRVKMIEALESIGVASPRTVRSLAAALADEDPRVRLAAANGLRTFGPAARAAIGPLEAALTDANDDVRKAASDALLAVTTGK